MRKVAWIASAAVVLLAWMGTPVSAQETSLAIEEIAAGFDGYCRVDRWCPISVVLSNEGPDVEGEVLVPWTDSGRGGATYLKRVTLPAHSRKVHTLYLPGKDPTGRSKLTVTLRAAGKELLSEEVVLTWLDEGEPLYGVVSGGGAAFGFLGDVAPIGGRSAVAYPDLAALPADPLGWEGLDVLVLNDVDTTAFDAEHRRALETWVAHGGHLIVGGGAGVARTAAGVADLLPVSVGGTRSVDTLKALGEEMGVSTAVGPYAVAEATLREGEVLIEQDGLILFARRAYGDGLVDFLAFDAGVNPFVDEVSRGALWTRVIEPDVSSAQQLTVRNGSGARDAVDAIPGLQLPSTLVILALLLVYVVLIGPANYLVLRKLDKRELAWITIPVLIVGFSACAYVAGSQIRGGNAIVHRLAVVYVPGGTRVGRVSQVVGLFSPRRADYDVRTTGLGLRGISGYYPGSGGGQALRVFEEAEGATLDDLRVDVGGIQPFVVEGYVETAGVEANLSMNQATSGRLQLEGTVRNGEIALEDAVILARGSVQQLGDLEAGEEVEVSLVFIRSAGGKSLAERVLGSSAGAYSSDLNLRRRYAFLQSLSAYRDSWAYGGVVDEQLTDGAYLVGWAEEDGPLPVEVLWQSFVERQTALYVYALPVEKLAVGSGGKTISATFIERELVKSNGHVEEASGEVTMGASAEAIFRFAVWPEVTVPQVDEIALDMRGRPEQSPPAVLIWNREMGRWDTVDAGWGQSVIPDAGPYVSSLGHVLVYLKAADAGGSLTYVTITYFSVTIRGH